MKIIIFFFLDKLMYNFCINYIGRKVEEFILCIIFYCEDFLFVVIKKLMVVFC